MHKWWRGPGRRIGFAGIAAAALFLLSTRPAVGQVPATQFTLDFEAWGLGVTYARAMSDSRAWGVGAGLGGSLSHWSAFSQDHFSAGDTDLFELLHVEGFNRIQLDRSWTTELGLRSALLLHGDSGSGGNSALALFAGFYSSLHWGWGRLRVGPRLHLGVFSEGPDVTELGFLLTPITGRIIF